MLLGILFCLVLAIPSSEALASESFTLNVPVRFNANQETGEVRITLSLDAAPAGAQLVEVGAVAGAYNFDPGDENRAGANTGVGVLYEFTSTFGIEAAWNYHIVNTDNDNASSSALQAGMRFGF